MRQDLQDASGFNFHFMSGKYGFAEVALAGNITLDAEGPLVYLLDPDGSDRNVTLPVFEPGLAFVVAHTGTANSLAIKNSAGTTLATISLRETIQVYSTRNGWVLTPWTFGAAGAVHNAGLVPDPGAVAGLVRFLCDDGTWRSVTAEGIVDAYKTITDGSTSAVAAGLSTFKLRSSDGTISVVVTDNDATHGDNANFAVVESNVDHDALGNFVADEHIAHSSITLTAGSGLSGGGTIAANRTFALDLSNISTIAIAAADTIPFWDTSGAVNGKTTFTLFNAALDHNALTNYDANRHIDHTAVSISAGTGLQGGGTIAASRTLSLDWNGLTAKPEGMAAGDLFAYYDASLSGHYKITFSELNLALDHNVLTNYVADQHVAHSGVSITGTGNLTGGGTIAASRTLDMANMADSTIKGRAEGAGTGTPTDLTGAQVYEISETGKSVVTKTTAGSYTMLTTDDIILINKASGAATTVDLVTAVARNRPIKIVDVKGDAASNPITIDASSTQTICGALTYVIAFNYGSVVLWPLPDGTGWYI